MKKELAVLGIEAHDIGRKYIDCEIRREAQNLSCSRRRTFTFPVRDRLYRGR
jgi:hypothetical protein